ncbi:ArnT family glycosyltransferase [Parvularcula lutaonensis]|uniref:ArnT family glycosyltransferase n=1 Tax=Parvularcula lutaonensis TaxID=491923 RepID=A0ABV7MA74_9PROT|nr:glycosyltransferase family 39 protein [Parvularcula lutaonensis]GGY36277.1 hypothetical protein GCM10007148_00540 [Parvularcula lutaonensis]
MFRRALSMIDQRPAATAVMLTSVFVIARLLHLAVIDTNLGADEAQYWFWSRDLDWGYYSKPPMVAWMIRLSTSLFGETEFGVRALSPILLGGTGLLLFETGRRLFGDRAGLQALLIWSIMPAVIYGGTVMATDIPMTFFLSASLLLLALTAQTTGKKALLALAAGAAAGATFLSKYAALYLFMGTGIALLASTWFRDGFGWRERVLWLLGAVIVAAPNVLWNLANGLQTVKHTADNANWNGSLIHPGEMVEFLVNQLGVLGPILFPVLIFAMVRFGFRDRGKEAFLLSFVLPPLVVISVQALLSRAHANWAMAAYPAACILLPVWLSRLGLTRWVLIPSIIIHGAVWILMAVVSSDFDRADALGFSNAYKRTRAWPETAQAILVRSEGYDGFIVDDREIAAHLVWELRNAGVTFEVFDRDGRSDNTYEYVMPFAPREGARRLLVTERYGDPGQDYSALGEAVPVGSIFIDLRATTRGRPARTLDLYEVRR